MGFLYALSITLTSCLYSKELRAMHNVLPLPLYLYNNPVSYNRLKLNNWPKSADGALVLSRVGLPINSQWCGVAGAEMFISHQLFPQLVTGVRKVQHSCHFLWSSSSVFLHIFVLLWVDCQTSTIHHCTQMNVDIFFNFLLAQQDLLIVQSFFVLKKSLLVC